MMDMTRLQQLDNYRWTTKEKKPVILFGSKELLEMMDDKVLEQISNVAALPGLVGSAMTMPDAHWGYGFPIGGVAAFDANKGGVISAGGVGFDISCGIRCLRTNLFLKDVLAHLEVIGDRLFYAIPAGVGIEGKLRVTQRELENIMQQGAKWAIKNGFGITEDLNYIEEKGCISNAEPEYVSDHAKKRQLGEMGTLGSGNHYLEVQVVKEIFDKEGAKAFGVVENQIVISIHCGSRGLGHQIGSDYLVSFAKASKELGIVLPERELACAPILSDIGQRYIGAMHSAINCALANRQILTHLTREAMATVFNQINIETLFDVSHNTCKREEHQIGNIKQEVYVHRKGATRAFGPQHPSLPKQYAAVGQPVCIGGSMGTGSYLLAGNSADLNHAFASACHGAGRQMSRRQALRKWRGRELIDELKEKGIYIRTRSMRGAAEEAPDAYKNVHQVVEATELAGLARRVAFLRPLVCVKG